MEYEIKKSDFVQSLEKGLKVITAFDQNNIQMTLTDVAKKVDLTRANARRILLTLQYLGYVKSDGEGRRFSLTAKTLSLGYSYLSALSFRELAQPYMQKLTSEVQESCSMSVMEGHEIVYIARVQTSRIMTISLGLGTRLPIHATSMGKALLSTKSNEEISKMLDEISYESFTDKTIISKEVLLKEVNLVRQRGWALADQELELGVRSVAAPIRDKEGKTVAALNISGHAGRVTLEEMKAKFVPALKRTVQEIEIVLQNL